MLKTIPPPVMAPATARLRFERFVETDGPALAGILADPEITRNITANGSTPERCAASAAKRIAWHNASWADKGYGVWALKAGAETPVPRGDIIGWCGFAAPDVPGEDPEILYGLARACWGQGLGAEAAGAAAAWLFEETDYQGFSALIFGRLNPGSRRIAGKLGMALRGTMPFKDFMPDPALARDVLNYEIWRLRVGDCADPEALVFQAPYKAGQIVATGIAAPESVLAKLCSAALAREEVAGNDPDGLLRRVRGAFHAGMAEDHLDWYHMTREAWRRSLARHFYAKVTA